MQSKTGFSSKLFVLRAVVWATQMENHLPLVYWHISIWYLRPLFFLCKILRKSSKLESSVVSSIFHLSKKQWFSHWSSASLSSANSSVISNLHRLERYEINCSLRTPEIKDFKQTFFSYNIGLSTKRYMTDKILVYSHYPFISIFLKVFVREESSIPLFSIIISSSHLLQFFSHTILKISI